MTDDHNFPPEPVPRRRTPAGQAIVVITVSLLVACLLNADRLDHTAHTQPFGWQRKVALDLTGPLKSISHATRLNLPRKWLSKSAGNVDPPPAIDTKGIVTAGERSATTTTTIPLPIRTPTATKPLRVLVSGDSLMGWIGPALDKALNGRPVQVTEDWKIATGLARPDVTNWPVQLNADMCGYDPEVVVIGFGGNDDQDMQTDDGVVHVGTKAWVKEYERRVVQILDDVNPPTSGGDQDPKPCPASRPRTVYWIGLPIVTKAHLAAASADMAKAIKAEIAIRPWAHYIDTRPILSPDGTYTAYLPDQHGTLVKVRENDGVHPNLAGATRIVAPVAKDIRKERKL